MSIQQGDAGATSPLELEREQLLELCHIAQRDPVISVMRDGSMTLSIRDGSIYGTLNPRFEYESGLLRVDLSIHSLQRSEPLPREVMAFADNRALACLTVAQTLELLYGDLPKLEDAMRWSQVSEYEDFRLPTNYRRLSEQTPDRRHLVVRAPALANVEGVTYPGPAILGDARFLSSFLLQREFCELGDVIDGWVMFDARELREGGELIVEIDFGNGPRRFVFTIPQR